MTIPNYDLEMPNGISARGRLAHRVICEVMHECEGDDIYTGGCKTFYSPEEWIARGEEYGRESELVIVHDGGEVAKYFNLDYECYDLEQRMQKELAAHGLYAEPCTSWYTAIYKI